MKKYKRYQEEVKYIDFTKSNDFVELVGELKNKNYNITIQWSGHKRGLNVECSIVTENGYEFIYGKNSNINQMSVEQTLTLLFINIFKIPVPKTDDVGSGLDVNYMIETLIKKYKFKIKKQD
jgi:hypothetical protein